MNGKDWEVKRQKLEKSKNADYWIPKIERNMKRDLDKKTCPEESLIQIGTMEKSVSPAVLAEIAPQQEKALEALGFERPHPDQKASKLNSRKITFDDACRVMLFDICERHGLHLDREPEYGGRAYLEKQDYILMKQKEKMGFYCF